MTTATPKIPIAERPLPCPFTVIVDGREGAPYHFEGLRADAAQHKRPLQIAWEWDQLKTGDYSIKGFENRLCVERKSLEDLFSTLGQNRERFEAEHQRMRAMIDAGGFACVIIESDWHTILKSPPERSSLLPKTVLRTAISWQQKYRVPWMAMGSRGLAEATTFRTLNKYWVDHRNDAAGSRATDGDADPFQLRRMNDPQGVIDDLLKQTARQGKTIYELNKKLESKDPASQQQRELPK